ncbi:hypothetical protein DV737_g3023, partial [Chaetothyriales sp. CBS 132003]
MDIHRCRFVEFPAAGISSLAFSHASNPAAPAPPDLRLAVGREGSGGDGGNIEIWNRILRGGQARTVEQVAWTQDVDDDGAEEDGNGQSATTPRPLNLRLFSIGGSAAVTEWDLGAGVPKKQAESNVGDIWCFAAQPRAAATTADTKNKPSTGMNSQLLAAGCSDGSIVLFSTEDEDLRFWRVLLPRPAGKTKVLSLAWRDAHTVVAGYENGTIRVIDVPSRRTVRQVTLGNSAAQARGSTRSVVWTVKCLPDGTVVSGDSAGELKVWDARNLSLVQTLRTHQSDILDIACNASGDRLWTVGIDRRTVSYRLSTVPGVRTRRWVELYHRQFHKNDAKCIAAFESVDAGVLVSGGMDAGPIVQSMGMTKKHHRTLPHLPQQAPVATARRARLFVSWWQQQIHVYGVAKRDQAGQAAEQKKKSHSLVGTLQLKGDQHIEAAAISEDGNLILASTSAGVRLFQVRVDDTGVTAAVLRSRQIDLPASLQRLGARLVGISPNSKWLYAVGMDNTVVVCKLLAGTRARDKPRIHRAITKLIVPSTPTLPALGRGAYTGGVCAATFSPDSRVIAVGTLGGEIAAWVLTGHEDESGDGESVYTPTIDSQRWIMTPDQKVARFPQLDSAITVLTFRPSSSASSRRSTNGSSNIGLHATRHNPHPIAHEQPATAPQLLAISADGTLIEVDVYTGRLSEWWRRNSKGLQLAGGLLGRTKDVVRGCFWDSTQKRKGRQRQRLWLYGSMVVCMLDADVSAAASSSSVGHDGDNDEKEKKWWSTFEYRAILGAGVIGEEEEVEVGDAMDIGGKEEGGDAMDIDGKEEGEDDGDDEKNIEVVIIERPLWDVQAAAA